MDPEPEPPKNPSNKDERAESAVPEVDTRSPLERFRKPPKKALSVTDLVSPAWCELQYFYTLSKHGRKRRTPAMKQGSMVHQALEDEIHITVPVDTTTREDSWGLRMWNICQGLRTLRDTGKTRELEIWGTVGGQLVNGIIDELSYECPDPKFKEEVGQQKPTTLQEVPEYQTTLEEFLITGPAKDRVVNQSQASVQQSQDEKQIYITDTKTRTTPTLPTGSSIRPTLVQLHLYHHMLENLVQGNLPLAKLLDRYGLDGDATFSDSLLAQLSNLGGRLDREAYADQCREEEIKRGTIAGAQDNMDVILEHNNLKKLWGYMISEFQKTFLRETEQTDKSHDAFANKSKIDDLTPPSSQQSTSALPPPPSNPTRLSSLLTARYIAQPRSSSPHSRVHRRVLGHKSTPFSAQFLKEYLTGSLAWWRGERMAMGVSVDEAWKCRGCEFREGCEWVAEREKEGLERAWGRRSVV